MSRRQQREFPLIFSDEDRVRIRFTTDKSAVAVFTVQYEARIAGQNYPVVRYDTVHGFAHRDTLDWSGRVAEKWPLPSRLTFNEALIYAIEDIRANWETYREAFLRMKP